MSGIRKKESGELEREFTFTYLSDVAIEDLRLTQNDVSTLLSIAHFTDKKRVSWPGKAKIAKYARISVTSVKRSLTHLQKLGYLSVKHRKDPENSQKNQTNSYRVIDVPKGHEKSVDLGSERTQGGVSVNPGVGSERTQGGVSVSPKQETMNYNQVEKESKNKPEIVLASSLKYERKKKIQEGIKICNLAIHGIFDDYAEESGTNVGEIVYNSRVAETFEKIFEYGIGLYDLPFMLQQIMDNSGYGLYGIEDPAAFFIYELSLEHNLEEFLLSKKTNVEAAG